MNKFFTILVPMAIGILLTVNVFAQISEKISYHSVIKDASDKLVTSQTVGMQLSILQGSISGAAVYVETQTPTTNANGLISIEIGTGTSSDDFSTIDWATGTYFIKTETDPTGGTSYTIIGTGQLLSVPYALHSKTAEAFSGGSGITHTIGDFAQGGIVFWIDETGQHGLVTAKVDQDGGSGIKWYNGTYTETEANGDGEMNTFLIIANQGSNSNDYAAGVCANYTVTESGVSYGDWYLPSKKELNLMYQNKATINATSGANGGSAFVDAGYWSSTENDSRYAYFQNFNSSSTICINKSNTFKVRAVRRF